MTEQLPSTKCAWFVDDPDAPGCCIGCGEPREAHQRPTIEGLERLLDSEPKRPIKILPDGSIEEIPGEPLPEIITRLVNQAWDY